MLLFRKLVMSELVTSNTILLPYSLFYACIISCLSKQNEKKQYKKKVKYSHVSLSVISIKRSWFQFHPSIRTKDSQEEVADSLAMLKMKTGKV